MIQKGDICPVLTIYMYTYLYTIPNEKSIQVYHDSSVSQDQLPQQWYYKVDCHTLLWIEGK